MKPLKSSTYVDSTVAAGLRGLALSGRRSGASALRLGVFLGFRSKIECSGDPWVDRLARP